MKCKFASKFIQLDINMILYAVFTMFVDLKNWLQDYLETIRNKGQSKTSTV